jgi:hypothetical protein
MRFMLLIYNNAEFDAAIHGPDIDDSVREEWASAHAQLAELAETGELVRSNELSKHAALIVRSQHDDPHRVSATVGPFSESEMWVGGYYVVDCDTIERAAEIAGRFVEARYAPIEVRQLVYPDA